MFLLQCNGQRFIRWPSKVSAISPEFYASTIFFEIVNLCCFHSRCIWENRDQIRTKLHTGNRVQNTYNYSLEGRCHADIVEQVHSDIMTRERTRFEINYSYGVVLRNVETDQLLYFYGRLDNAHKLDFAVLISNQEHLRNFLENICDFDMREKIERPDTDGFWSRLSTSYFLSAYYLTSLLAVGWNYPPTL